ncbi:aldehyde dehydrogenase (NADP(+)) [Pararhizobium haloflavum]|uniref:aldehyde dehydrogenase (NADP(+)) n=1 Tax=Pararhizobium haloflavum TaxID=2037914 RepID=UPI000C17FDB6|nr:aldehyde dehydrogenase (NADP(+)) [Pararhizobium haloflavum]
MTDGKHLIAGEWVAGSQTFASRPATGEPRTFAEGGAAEVDRAAKAAEDAFWTYGYLPDSKRASFLNRIAEEITARKAAIVETAMAESGLPQARLEGECGRTTGQLQLFARHIEKGDYLDRRHDEALPDRQPAPRPDLRLMQRPIGPVGVFGASNFPLAFSTAGGDTASALAAGCPVVVKGHPAHPGTAQHVAEAIDAAIRAEDMPPGVFSLIHGSTNALGEALVSHPLIRAIGFTGSLGGGRALYDIAQNRPEPIPFFGELGSVNPVFVLPAAAKARASQIGKSWAGSLTMGVGQFCTNPGVVVMPEGEADAFIATTSEALEGVAAQTMLGDGIADAYRKGLDRIAAHGGTQTVWAGESSGRNSAPAVFVASGETWLAEPDLHHEVFGPLGIVVKAKDVDQMLEIARGLEGQLTCTLQLDEADHADARRLLPILERKAGRLLANGFPTGVEVADAMMHGGPYPASTQVSTTSVGTLAIRRFLRPVCYQDIPASLLPEALN